MQRLRRVSSLWSWLPAFRAVAETEHLPTASAQLFVSASALSRTIRLLEEDLGHPLFLRNGRRIELNESGQRLLGAVRSAMRMIHEGLEAIDGTELAGPVHVSTARVTTAHVLAGLRRLRQEHPELVPHVVEHDDHDVAERLLRGDVDVAFVTEPIAHDQLTTQHLGSASSGIYCGPGHPLHGAPEVTIEQVLEHAFVALAPDDRGLTPERWPATLERRVGMVVSGAPMGLEVCAQGDLLAVLPDVVAGSALHRGRLRRLAPDVLEAIDVFALHRAMPTGRAQAVTRAVAHELAAAAG